jgi:hypothetical protein
MEIIPPENFLRFYNGTGPKGLEGDGYLDGIPPKSPDGIPNDYSDYYDIGDGIEIRPVNLDREFPPISDWNK